MFGKALARGGLAATVAAAAFGAAFAAEPAARPRRVLSIHAFEPGVPVDAVFTAGLRAALPLGPDVAIYSEHVDRLRFPDPRYEEGFRAWVREKYARAPPDVIVAAGPDAIAFLSDPAKTPFPGVPVVFGMVIEGASPPARLPAHFTGVTEHLAIRETLDLALALFPDTRRVALVGGASAWDRPLNELLRREVAAARRDVEIVELFGQPMKDLQERLRALPPRTVVIVVSFAQDGAGRQWGGPQSVPAMVSASTAPVFTVVGHVLGYGVTGGVLTDFGETGRAVARAVLRVLAGEPVETIPVQRGAAGRVALDARQLARWGVPDARVPAGAEVRFREPSAWTRHRWEIVAAAVAFLVQSALIALLLVERRRRWRAEAKARENLTAVARMNRVSALGELVASLAHEINSPLGAVLNNAEAAQRFLAAGSRDDAEVRSCLEDIVRDVTRADDVIRRIRGVLRRESWTPVPLDVAAVIRDALRLVGAEVRDRGVDVQLEVAPALPAVVGDEVQLVQVILNLLINALDAVAGAPGDRRRVRISAVEAGGAVAIRVEDWGHGVPEAIAGRVFEPFFTTKPAGLGMGLAVTRSIVEAHRGTIAVARAPGGGAAFEVRLPPAAASPAAARAKAAG
ncbi:MAG TPA: ABC transporter substrate binding protein [Anaeromyxobacter sp.]|nr:ABC transporter substrate binding protein [Anaeromyxobacter sp.]